MFFTESNPQPNAWHIGSVHPISLELDLAIQLCVQPLMTNFFFEDKISVCVTRVATG